VGYLAQFDRRRYGIHLCPAQQAQVRHAFAASVVPASRSRFDGLRDASPRVRAQRRGEARSQVAHARSASAKNGSRLRSPIDQVKQDGVDVVGVRLFLVRADDVVQPAYLSAEGEFVHVGGVGAPASSHVAGGLVID